MNWIFYIPLLAFIVYAVIAGRRAFSRSWRSPKKALDKTAIVFLHDHVSFYRSLKPDQKELFEYKVNEFMYNVDVVGIQVDVSTQDRLLVAASAVIPVFAFPDWQYLNLDEVLLYPSSFNQNFQTRQSDSSILGMVGSGPMDGKMILSKKALYDGFRNEDDAHHTAIHEFVHLIDKMDGDTDGIPNVLIEKQYVLPWMALMDEYIKKIRTGNSAFDPYAGVNRTEFFAVLAVYFFERPAELKLEHPELYNFLEQMFKQKMSVRRQILARRTRRNETCPCGSGRKFKRCCGKNA